MALEEKTQKELCLEHHQQLACVQQDICWLKKIMGNHLTHHWIITVSVAASMLSAIGVLVMYIITVL